MRRIVKWLGGILIRRVTRRAPDVIIGGAADPYMLRWWVIPRNRFFNLYLHRFLRSDDERALHDHPWANVSILLDGSYVEVMPIPKGEDEILRIAQAQRITSGLKPWPESVFLRFKRRNTGDIAVRKATALHRIKLFDGPDGKPIPAWSFFITGRVVRTWGFMCPQGWRKWTDFTANHTNEHGQTESKVTRGCD